MHMPMLHRGLADSKTLTEEKRETLFAKLAEEPSVGVASDVLTAALISSKMLARETVSLNVLAAESTFRVIDSVLSLGVNITDIFVDTVGDADRYKVTWAVPCITCHAQPRISISICHVAG
jgi:ribonuclease H2 subunit A